MASMETELKNLLEQALQALEQGRDDDARQALLDAWRRSRSPSVAALAELAFTGVDDVVHKALASVLQPRAATSLERLQALAGVDDPRLGRFALDALESLPFASGPGEDFLQELVAVVRRLKDRRLVSRASAVRTAIRARIKLAPLRDALLDLITGALDDLDELPAPPVLAEQERKLSERLEPHRSGEKTETALLSAVYESPLEDGPRLVYSDWLQERGDPRGEFIVLQFKARSGGLTKAEAAREAKLLKQHGKAWLGPLASVVSASRFARGFLEVAKVVQSSGKKLELVMREPAWATVEELNGGWSMEMLSRSPLRALKRVDRWFDAVTVPMLARLPHRLYL